MPQTAFLKNRFGLTPAEARLVLRLIGRFAALSRESARHRIRNSTHHLKSIFQKTGTRRQAELVIVVIHAFSDLP